MVQTYILKVLDYSARGQQQCKVSVTCPDAGVQGQVARRRSRKEMFDADLESRDALQSSRQPVSHAFPRALLFPHLPRLLHLCA
jgi:hypothetical protein